MTSDELRKATEPWRTAKAVEVRLRSGRDDLIRCALVEGMSERKVAEAVGVSHGLPALIAKK